MLSYPFPAHEYSFKRVLLALGLAICLDCQLHPGTPGPLECAACFKCWSLSLSAIPRSGLASCASLIWRGIWHVWTRLTHLNAYHSSCSQNDYFTSISFSLKAQGQQIPTYFRGKRAAESSWSSCRAGSCQLAPFTSFLQGMQWSQTARTSCLFGCPLATQVHQRAFSCRLRYHL